MRVGIVVPGFSTSADDWCIPALRDLVGQLARIDDVRVLALRYPGRAAQYDVVGARVIALGGGDRPGVASADLWRRALATLAAEHRRRRFDVLHAFWATEAGFLTALAGRVLGIPTVVSVAGGELVRLPDLPYGDQLTWSGRLKTTLALRLATTVAVGSRLMLAIAAPWLNRRPCCSVRVLPLGVNAERFQPPTGRVASERIRMIHVGSLTPVKDQALLLRALARLGNEAPPWTLDLVGSGPLEPSLRALAERLGLASAIHFVGARPHDHLPALYQQADVFLLGSRHEAQGMAVLEAAATGIPTVGTHVGVIPELAPGAAATGPVGDAASLAGAIGQLLGDGPRRQAMGEAARAAVIERFGLARRTTGFRRAYEEVRRGGRS